MKTRILSTTVWLSLALCAAAQVPLQVQFQNQTGTGEPGGSPVTNALTGARVPAGTEFLVQLYFGPEGVPEEGLISVTNLPVGFVSPGFFNGGVVTLPLLPAPEVATLQVRSWEARLGATYEAAVAACDAGGSGLSGESGLFVVRAPLPPLPNNPLPLAGLRSFGLEPCEGPPRASIRSSEVEVCWSTRSNHVYRVDYRSDLTTNRWTALATNVGTGSTACITDKVPADQPERFYRVVILH